MSKFARVSVNIAQITDVFDYAIPAEMEASVQPGSLVTVPFGRQLVQALVLSLMDAPSVPEVRAIEGLVDRAPVLTAAQMELAGWMADYYFSTLAENLRSDVAPASVTRRCAHPRHRQRTGPDLTPVQQRILKALGKQGVLRGRQLDAALPKTNWRESLPGLLKRGLATSEAVLLPPSVHPRTLRNASLLVSSESALEQINQNGRRSAAVKQRLSNAILVLAREDGPTDVSMLYAESGANTADLKTLADLGLISIGESEVFSDPLAELEPVLQQAPRHRRTQPHLGRRRRPDQRCCPAQTTCWGGHRFGKPRSMHAVQAALARGKGAIILVPEISLTPQTVRRFYARFPQKVGLIHSRLSPGERYDSWRRIRSGDLPVVVGARSALFAPLPNLGLIIIDECHDESYFQDDFRPHYSAVETAIAYARLMKIPLIMGSATPTVEQLYRARRESWQELHLAERIYAHQANQLVDGEPGTLPLPPVQIVDMREELKAGNRSVLSVPLKKALQETLDHNEQSILFLNRRGSATYVFCRDCGYVLRCPRCETQLTFHAASNDLQCHICNYHRKLPASCPQCSSKNIRQFGLGTESLEKQVVEQFPSARVLRWDADTARFKGAHDLILDHFTQHRADILIGTKMLAKGLDLPLVTLVGVILADVSLNLPDFHAPERTFQLLSQVAGRAGRSGRGGKAIFQTYHPENYAIQAASLHDFNGFYEQELDFRRKTVYPPFTQMIRFEFTHFQESVAAQAAQASAERFATWAELAGIKSMKMIGPVPCFYGKRNGQFRWHFILSGSAARDLLKQHPAETWRPHGVTVEITVDPPDLL